MKVPAPEAEFAADILWSAGAQAVEEIAREDFVELLTDLGDDPMTAWQSVVEREPLAASWKVEIKLVDRTVADTWRDFVEETIVGEVRIVPAWKSVSGEAESHDILIEPGGSFGMGDHPTTRATLELALTRTRHQAPSPSILDVGCGSGVLGIALARTREARVVAVDIAPAAIEATTINVGLNAVSDRFVIELGGINVVRGTYELVLANILAPVLLADAPQIAHCVAERGGLVLSGFTSSRLDDITAAYSSLGLTTVNVLEVDGWIGLEMERR